ncbi:hypothetical protein TUSST3_38110 [Streptomyces sp. TUS-ST3]|nr:hypothetical protein TUSST3_38110 [Streptomyces sp. TUS-ST3]
MVGQQRDHQGSPAGVGVDRPRHRLTAAQLQHIADQFEQGILVVDHTLRQLPRAVSTERHAAVLSLACIHPSPQLGLGRLRSRSSLRDAGIRLPQTQYPLQPRNYLPFLGLAAALCCYGRLVRLTTAMTRDRISGIRESTAHGHRSGDALILASG